MAVMVMAFGIVTAITTMNYGFRAIDTARNSTIASQLLQSVMEDVRMLPWSSTTGDSITSLESTQPTGGTLVTIGPSFTTSTDQAAIDMVKRFTVTRVISDVTSLPNVKKIDLTATWQGIDGRPHTLRYSSYYAKDGLHDYFVR